MIPAILGRIGKHPDKAEPASQQDDVQQVNAHITNATIGASGVMAWSNCTNDGADEIEEHHNQELGHGCNAGFIAEFHHHQLYSRLCASG